MATADKALAAAERAAQRVTRAEEALRAERAELRQAVRDAVDAGASLAAVGRALGISRQRVRQLVDDER